MVWEDSHYMLPRPPPPPPRRNEAALVLLNNKLNEVIALVSEQSKVINELTKQVKELNIIVFTDL